MGLFGILQAAVSAQSTNVTASASESKTQLKPVYPEVQYKVEPKKSETPAPAASDMKVTASESKTQMKPVFPATQYKVEAKKSEPAAPPATDKIVSYGSTSSSQAWNTIATRRENTTVFHDASTHEPQLVAFTFAFGKKNGNELQLGK